MSVGRKPDTQEELFVPHQQLRGLGHPFYDALDCSLPQRGFDDFAQQLCEPFDSHTGRPSLASGVYFRCLLVGYFEGIGSNRGIMWKIADSLSLRRFIGITMSDNPADHLRPPGPANGWMSTSMRRSSRGSSSACPKPSSSRGALSASTAPCSRPTQRCAPIVRRENGRSYDEFLDELAKASGIETPMAEDRRRMDRKRKGKKASNKDWVNPNDPEAEITKMKDGRMHLAYKQKHAIDLEGPEAIRRSERTGYDGNACADSSLVGYCRPESATIPLCVCHQGPNQEPGAVVPLAS